MELVLVHDQSPHHPRQPLAGELAIEHQLRRSHRDELLRVPELMVIGGVRIGHEHRGQPAGRDLGERGRTGAAEDQIGEAVRFGDVREEGSHDGSDPGFLELGLHPGIVLLAGLNDDLELADPFEKRQRVHQRLVQPARPPAATEHEERALIEPEPVALGDRHPIPAHDPLPHRIPGQLQVVLALKVAAGLGEGEMDLVGDASQEPVRSPRHRVLLEEHAGQPAELAREHHRGRSVGARAHHHVGAEAQAEDERGQEPGGVARERAEEAEREPPGQGPRLDPPIAESKGGQHPALDPPPAANEQHFTITAAHEALGDCDPRIEMASGAPTGNEYAHVKHGRPPGTRPGGALPARAPPRAGGEFRRP